MTMFAQYNSQVLQPPDSLVYWPSTLSDVMSSQLNVSDRFGFENLRSPRMCSPSIVGQNPTSEQRRPRVTCEYSPLRGKHLIAQKKSGFDDMNWDMPVQANSWLDITGWNGIHSGDRSSIFDEVESPSSSELRLMQEIDCSPMQSLSPEIGQTTSPLPQRDYTGLRSPKTTSLGMVFPTPSTINWSSLDAKSRPNGSCKSDFQQLSGNAADLVVNGYLHNMDEMLPFVQRTDTPTPTTFRNSDANAYGMNPDFDVTPSKMSVNGLLQGMDSATPAKFYSIEPNTLDGLELDRFDLESDRLSLNNEAQSLSVDFRSAHQMTSGVVTDDEAVWTSPEPQSACKPFESWNNCNTSPISSAEPLTLEEFPSEFFAIPSDEPAPSIESLSPDCEPATTPKKSRSHTTFQRRRPRTPATEPRDRKMPTARSTPRQRRARSAHSRRRLSHTLDPSGFVNFTPSDGSKLLNGVAPSGSSKTKARREREAADREKRLHEAAIRAVAKAWGDLSSLEETSLLI